MDWPALVAQMDAACIRHLDNTVSIYAPASGPAKEVAGIFDDNYLRVDASMPGVQSTGPAIFYRVQDLPVDPTQDDPTITVRGVAYRAKEVQPDGQGGVVITLEKA